MNNTNLNARHRIWNLEKKINRLNILTKTQPGLLPVLESTQDELSQARRLLRLKNVMAFTRKGSLNSIVSQMSPPVSPMSGGRRHRTRGRGSNRKTRRRVRR